MEERIEIHLTEEEIKAFEKKMAKLEEIKAFEKKMAKLITVSEEEIKAFEKKMAKLTASEDGRIGLPTYNDTIKVNTPFLALCGSYFCDDYPYIDFVLVVNGVNKKYKLRGIKSNDSTFYYFVESIWTDEFIKDFKSASKCSIRVNQDYCKNDYYQFGFSGSTAAYNFITK